MDWTRILSDGLRSGLGINAAVYALAAVGLNLQYGYTGLMNYGQAGFLLVGAYGTAVTVDQWGLPLPLAFLFGIAAAVGFGLLLGLPTLRLRADYLAIVTISAAEILKLLVNTRQAQGLTGGPQGINGFANDFFEWNPIAQGRYGFGAVKFSHRDLWVILVTWALVVVVTFVMRRLVHSPWGRVLRAIREDEDAVRSLGKNVVAYKMQSLVLGGAIGGLAGIMLVMDKQFVEPKLFESALTFFVYALLILGGLARLMGPIAGGMLFWFFVSGSQGFLIEAVDNKFLGIHHVLQTDDIGPVRFMIVGLLIMVLVVFRPQGAFGSRDDVRLR